MKEQFDLKNRKDDETEKKLKKIKMDTVKLTKMAMLVAISVTLVSLIHFPIFPAAAFLEYDPADIPIIIGTFAFGPLAGIVINVITSIVQGLTVSSAAGIYGIVMHIAATGTYVLVAGSIYSFKKEKKMAITALLSGTLCMTGAMFFANIIVTPIFTGLQPGVILKMMPLILTFNLIKAGVNSIITFFIYKKISRFLHGRSITK